MKRVLKFIAIALAALVGLLLVGFVVLKIMWSDTANRAPESATGIRKITAVQTSTTMVVAANPHAAEAGRRLLRGGGSAIDAAIAVQAALTVVEPQSSGIAGGAFLLYYDAEQGKLHAYDGRETAPAAATSALFMHEGGEPFNFVEAVVGGRSVGTPGVLRMLELAHKRHGKRPWGEAFGPGIELAERGFEISPRLYKLLHRDPLFRTIGAARSHFYLDDGRAKAVGTQLKNPQLAEVFKMIAKGGADAFYTGPIAQDIVKTVREAKRPSTFLAGVNLAMLEMGAPYGIGWMADEVNAGVLTAEDLKGYQAKDREPVCIPYGGGRYRVCGMPPPTSGGVTGLQILGILSHTDLAKHDPRSAQAAHLISEASKLAFADRGLYLGDPDFVKVPVLGLLSEEYLKARAALIKPDRSMGKAKPGKPSGAQANLLPDNALELPCTSHFSIVDARGNMVSMTTSVENVFGSRLMVRGFVLNNQLTDFAFVPKRDGRMVANALEPNKRPRSSMSPMIVFEGEKPLMAVGSPGGSRIIGYSAQAVLGVLVWGLSPQKAIELPHIVNRNGPLELENQGWSTGQLKKVKAKLVAMGHKVKVVEQNSGLHALMRSGQGWVSGVDPRREGAAKGD